MPGLLIVRMNLFEKLASKVRPILYEILDAGDAYMYLIFMMNVLNQSCPLFAKKLKGVQSCKLMPDLIKQQIV